MKIEELTSYRLVEKKKIEDLNSMSYLLEHKKGFCQKEANKL